MKKKKIAAPVKVLLALFSATAVSAAAFGIYQLIPMGEVVLPESSLPPESSALSEPSLPSKPESEPPPDPSIVRIKSAGDNLIHNSIYEQAAARAEGDGYDFTYAYENIAGIVADADISTLNQETVIAPDYEPSTYPCFNSPPELAETMTAIGFDVFNAANNHVLDKGEKGLVNCLTFWRENYPDYPVTGAYLDKEDFDDLRLMEKNGLTFAFLGATELTNGLSLPSGSEVVLMESTNEAMLKARVEAARKKADVVLMNIHWGNEYTHTPTDRQRDLAQKLADWGVDVIIGHHPHVLQPVEMLAAADGREVLAVFSLGNFISAQDRPARMVGGILDYTIRRETPESPIEITDVSFIPTITHYDAGFRNNRLYPLTAYTAELAQSHGVRGKNPEFSLDYIHQLLDDVIYTEQANFLAPPDWAEKGAGNAGA